MNYCRFQWPFGLQILLPLKRSMGWHVRVCVRQLETLGIPRVAQFSPGEKISIQNYPLLVITASAGVCSISSSDLFAKGSWGMHAVEQKNGRTTPPPFDSNPPSPSETPCPPPPPPLLMQPELGSWKKF